MLSMDSIEKMDEEKRPLLASSDRDRKESALAPKWWQKDWCPWIPARYVLAIVSCLGFCNVYALRVNLSVAIVEMDSDTSTLHTSARASS